jgi:hypothetical protein
MVGPWISSVSDIVDVFIPLTVFCFPVCNGAATYNHQQLFSPSFLHQYICHIHASYCFSWCVLQHNFSGTHLLCTCLYPTLSWTIKWPIQSWHHVSWVFIVTVILILFLIMASTHPILSCVCWRPSRTFFIPIQEFFFKWLTNLSILCHSKQPSPYCPSMLL